MFKTRKAVLLAFASLAVAGLATSAPGDTSSSSKKIQFPLWQSIFASDGSFKDEVGVQGLAGANGQPDYIDLYGGVEAQFMVEELSNGRAVDMSALLAADSYANEAIFRGEVRGRHDLGNAYVMATQGEEGGYQFFVGVERLVSNQKSFIDFEFTREPMLLGQGAPWTMQGQEAIGDLRVRMAFDGDGLKKVKVYKRKASGFKLIARVNAKKQGNTYYGPSFSYSVSPALAEFEGHTQQVFDAQWQAVDPGPASQFLEVGIDIHALLGETFGYSTLMIRTPEDIVFNTFSNVGLFAELSDPLDGTQE